MHPRCRAQDRSLPGLLLAACLLALVPSGPAAAADGPLMTVVKSHLAQSDWKFQPVEGRPVLRLGCKGTDTTWTCLVEVREDRHFVGCYSLLPTKVPPEKRLLAAEYLIRANYGLKLGNFDMDFTNGQVLFRTTVTLEDGVLTPQMFGALLTKNVLIVDRYLGGLDQVLSGKASPAQAAAEADKKP